VEVFIPQKKPRGGAVSASEKALNRSIARVRVMVEQAIGGIKRLKGLSERYRNHRPAMEDTLIQVGCGLWNLHIQMS